MKKLTILLPLTLSLAGCGGALNSNFDCPNKPGVMCRSLDQVNSMVNRGELGKDDGIRKAGTEGFSHVVSILKTTRPLRANDQVMRIWIAPYQDKDGNYHDEGMLYTVVAQSHWQAPAEVKE